MRARPLNRLFLVLLTLAATATAPARINAQLVRDGPPQKAASPPSKAQDGAPGGKLRLTQDVSLSGGDHWMDRSEEHTSELQSRLHLVCRLLLEKKKKNNPPRTTRGTTTRTRVESRAITVRKRRSARQEWWYVRLTTATVFDPRVRWTAVTSFA